MNKELKPCPFCGREADLSNTAVKQGNNFLWSVECMYCGVIITAEAEDRAVELWNRRTIDE